MKPSIPLWRRPRRLITFVLTLVSVCYLLSVIPPAESSVVTEKSTGVWTSVLPPIIAILIALFFRSLVAALSSAFLVGSFLAFGPEPWVALPQAAEQFVWANLKGRFNIYIFGFLFTLIGTIHVINRNGGIHSAIRKLEKIVRGRRSAKLAIFLSGLAVFFDDYSNTVVVGSTMRSLSDRWRISREKLAYIVDSTTAPIAGLAIISTWIAFEVSLFQGVNKSLQIDIGGYELFFSILHLRFYCIGTILFVFLILITNRDFGPMLKAETRTAKTGKPMGDNAKPLVNEHKEDWKPIKGYPNRWYNSVIPLATIIIGAFGGIIFYGRSLMLEAGTPFSLFSSGDLRSSFEAVSNTYETGGVMKVLFLAALGGALVAIILTISQRILSLKETIACYFRTLPFLYMAIFILVTAWSMKSICADTLHTDTYLLSIIGNGIPLQILPLLTFLIASVMAFAMGTSWATMGILIPILLPLAYNLGAWRVGEDHLYFLLVAAAVLDGAIFGDHCSPISDTTVLSSLSTGCDHIDHVTTQLTYAVTTMVLVSLLGYVAVAVGMPAILFPFVFLLTALGLILTVGKKVPT
jgi:Na+/H+ antiporter NhaC